MPSPIREQILTALVTTLEGVTVAAGYRTTITEVEVLAKDAGSADLHHALLPWAGIIPGDETGRYMPFGHRVIDWPILIIVHFELATRTAAGLITACEAIRTDIARALHAVPTLAVDGVHFIQIEGAQTSEASSVAIQKSQAGVQIKTKVRFTESVSAS